MLFPLLSTAIENSPSLTFLISKLTSFNSIVLKGTLPILKVLFFNSLVISVSKFDSKVSTSLVCIVG